MDDRLTAIEETLAELLRSVDEMSAVVAKQDAEIARLTARVEYLMRRQAEAEAGAEGGVVVGDERPPHW
ncbi:SlyX family protein [Aestuariibius sp. 2305UL40-4]|uniref:SlyX family protein n=1 Tax=Aestuariibius violaceus TaxID=3234132 RepID=UPI00345EC2CB